MFNVSFEFAGWGFEVYRVWVDGTGLLSAERPGPVEILISTPSDSTLRRYIMKVYVGSGSALLP